MTNDELIQQLQSRGLINESVATRLKRDAIVSGDPPETIIGRERLVPDEQMVALKSELLKVPYKKIDPTMLNDQLMGLIPEETARTYQLVPISLQDGLLVIGMLHPDDVKAQDAIKFIARQNHINLGVYLISYGDLQAVLRKYSPYRTEIEAAVRGLNIKEGGGGQQAVELSGGDSADAPIIKIVADTFKEAVLSKASDVHIEPQQRSLRIRLRIDGDLHEVASLPVELAQPVTSRVKVISSLKIDETRVPQDGRFRAKIFDRDIDFRVATFPTPLGEKIAIRVLDPTTGLKNFESLDLLPPTRAVIKEGLNRPFGMVLITGPTGSGKTTTLYAFLQDLNTEDVNIVSLEDPVEYFVSGINQSQVRPEIGYDFASGLRQILRQDPDVIMVGEIRDNETAGLAVQAALTGHVVLSTLHTNNSAGVIPRLIDMKVEPFLIPVSVSLVIAQRLVGVLCPDCKAPEEAAPEVQEIIKRSLAGLPAEVAAEFKPPYQIYHAKGCATCKGRGVVGRTGIYEAFLITKEIENIVSSGATTQKITAQAKAQGMISLRQDGIVKALKGSVPIEEIIRETEEG
ncbi:MAG TPA: ATPase, T2SS/T4P/T4SS family [Candidatus Paceibacterota bacterium]|nr:ATPase, T2SS/T4P/T4SS family [Candidatus Paceibacterota bacterium]